MAPSAKQLTVAECDKLLCEPGSGSFFETETMAFDGNVMRVWKNAPKTFRSFLDDVFHKSAAREFLSSPAADGEENDREHITYGDTYKRAVVLAAWLREQGVGVGTRVAIGGLNSIEWVVSFMAVHLLGGAPILVNSTLHGDMQLGCLGDTKPAIVLVDGRLARTLGPLGAELMARGVGQVYCWSGFDRLPHASKATVKKLDPHPSQRTVQEVQQGLGLERLNPESVGLILFTSGTTNKPKAVMVTQRAALSHQVSTKLLAARAALRRGASLETALAGAKPKSGPQEVMLVPVPLFHVTGCLSWLVRAMCNGFKIVFMRKWDVPTAVKVMEAEGVTIIGGVPAIVTALLQSPLLPKDYKINSISYGGAPPAKRLAGDVHRRWPEAGITHGYGMTETNGLLAGVVGQDYIDRPDSIGMAFAIGDVRIVDPETRRPLGPNELGIIEYRGSNNMVCYLDNPKATKEALDPEGWYHTGDMAVIDNDGWIYIRDRYKDIIIRGGENIASAEVENALHLDDRIAHAAAVPVPDDVLGELVGVAVQLAPGASATPKDIIAHVEPRLRRAAVPVIVVITKSFPRNAAGKIVKKDVKQMVQAMWAAQKAPYSVPKARL